MAVHFQSAPNPIDQACLIALAQSQIDILNNDFQGVNVDISNRIDTDSDQFPGVDYGETCIEFCLASNNHPSGYGLIEGEPAVTINTTSGDFDNNWSGYINIWVRNITALGYSPLGGSGNGDGVVIDDAAFGEGAGCNGFVPNAPYNLGRTLTHELGHYLNLDHIWGNGCGSDDSIADTPDSSEEYYGCPSGYPSTCNSTDMYMNYMDYVNDLCMYMFSAGQATVMENYIALDLGNVVTNGAIVCAQPTCTDGIQNGDETDVDCGGSTCDPCPEPTCTDGKQNGAETGIDCGGPDCPECPPCIDIAISITFDNYPEETSWTIEDENNNTVASGGTYGGEADGSTIIISECLPAGCYDFTISDTYGDGICCNFGNGSYDVSVCGGSSVSGSTFGSSETTNFCIANEYIFLGTIDNNWDIDANWNTLKSPPIDTDCTIRISDNCIKTGPLTTKGLLIIDAGIELNFE